ncbi:hypothetical protein OG21DRAFT_564464 [Imleria badia]|nr:hypothetical protein OG21DRAFT_564464 [Imleria badia]
MKSTDFPTFLWKSNGYNFDPDYMYHGPFEGEFLERVIRHIFTGPSTALGGGPRRSRPNDNNMQGIDQANAAQIAYAAVQARWGINPKSRWSGKDGDFSYKDFYYSIVDFIENCEDKPWQDKLLKCYNLILLNSENGRKLDFEQRSRRILEQDESTGCRPCL